jgi:hypothetical protein
MPLKWMIPTSSFLNPHERAKVLGNYHGARRRGATALLPKGFDFPTQLIGKTPDGYITLYVDPSLGKPGADLAEQIFTMIDRTYAHSRAYFNLPAQPVNVIIAALGNATDGSGGAYHYGCGFDTGGDIYCDAAFGNPRLTNGLIVAELTESFMGAQDRGWDCGGSNGEALSRFLAELESDGPRGALADFSTGPLWDRAGRPNWIDATEPTDRDGASIGCGVVYLYWMVSKGITAARITQAGCPDGILASNYSVLTGATDAWKDFIAAVGALPQGVVSDDPWATALPTA